MIAYLAFVFASLFFRILQSLPMGGVTILGRWIGLLGWWLDVSHRRTAIRNAGIALGVDEAGRIARDGFLRTVENLFLSVWMAGRRDEEIRSLFEISGVRENLIPAANGGKGVIHVMFHLGNWELLSRIIRDIPEIKFSTIYQPLKNPWFDRQVSKWRQLNGVGLINRHHGFTEAVACLRRGEAVGMLVDQHAGDHGMWIPFFDRLASTTSLPAILARRTGAPIIPIFCSNGRNGKTRWHVEFSTPVSTKGLSDGEIMCAIHARLEEVIRRDPSNWFWVHDRWKTPSPNFLVKKYRRGMYVSQETKLKPFRVLVRCPNWLGDAVLAIPALRAIKNGRPDCHLTVLTRPKLADLWMEQSYVDSVVTSMDEARVQSFDAAVLLTNSLRTALEIWRLGIPRRLGYAGHQRGWLLTAICPEEFRAKKGQHEVKDFCGLARWLGAEMDDEIPKWDVPPSVKLEVQHPESCLVLHPGAAHGSAKRWLPERFVELAQRFPNERWIVIGSAEEKERNHGLVLQMGKHVEDWTGQLTLPELGRLLSQVKAVVCNDSGPMHLAAAVGTRTIAIFGSTEPSHTGPLGEGHQVLRHPVECSPCYLKECPIDLRCMKGVSVEDIAQRLKNFLG